MYEELHEEYAPKMLDIILQQGGFNLKTGQMIASNFGNGAPKKWQQTFEPLLDHVPHKSFDSVRATVEAGLGAKLEDVFSSFATEPLAAASIGQVHRAVLRSNGRRVVVKVQYPEVEALFRGDVHTAKTFAKVALPEHVPALNEIERQFATEFDYRREAGLLSAVRANLAAGGFKDIVVPEPLPELCSKNVLVMEEVLECEKLTSALTKDMEMFAKRRGITTAALLAEEEAANKAAIAKGVLRMGPTASEMDMFQSSLWWSNLWKRATGQAPEHVPLNHARLMDELLRVHGHELFVDGAFNADPHPGNVLVTRAGGRTRLALVDYGQVKTLSQHQRLQFARLIVALSRADHSNAAHRARVGALINDMGLHTARDDPDVCFEIAKIFFDVDDPIALKGKHIQVYLEDLYSRDASVAVGEEFVLAGRCSVMLRGLGHSLNQHRSGAKAWAPFAERVMVANGEVPGNIFAARMA
jgi:aarF domain-containing kinase